MNFATAHHRPDRPLWPRWPTSRPLARALLGCCMVAVVTTAFPWVRILVPSLWGEVLGPVAARTDAGFTCVTTCLLTALLVLVEGSGAQTREAVRTGCLLMMAIAAAVIGWRLLIGPGELRGVSMAHSGWFFAAVAAVAVGVVLCQLRLPRPARTR
ncbi:MAG: hypothetical protein AB7O97_13090 [Planctomycetota bacterium]